MNATTHPPLPRWHDGAGGVVFLEASLMCFTRRLVLVGLLLLVTLTSGGCLTLGAMVVHGLQFLGSEIRTLTAPAGVPLPPSPEPVEEDREWSP